MLANVNAPNRELLIQCMQRHSEFVADTRTVWQNAWDETWPTKCEEGIFNVVKSSPANFAGYDTEKEWKTIQQIVPQCRSAKYDFRYNKAVAGGQNYNKCKDEMFSRSLHVDAYGKRLYPNLNLDDEWPAIQNEFPNCQHVPYNDEFVNMLSARKVAIFLIGMKLDKQGRAGHDFWPGVNGVENLKMFSALRRCGFEIQIQRFSTPEEYKEYLRSMYQRLNIKRGDVVIFATYMNGGNLGNGGARLEAVAGYPGNGWNNAINHLDINAHVYEDLPEGARLFCMYNGGFSENLARNYFKTPLDPNKFWSNWKDDSVVPTLEKEKKPMIVAITTASDTETLWSQSRAGPNETDPFYIAVSALYLHPNTLIGGFAEMIQGKHTSLIEKLPPNEYGKPTGSDMKVFVSDERLGSCALYSFFDTMKIAVNDL